MELSLFVSERASSALSIPEAVRELALGESSSSWERSRPREGAADFFWACLPPPPPPPPLGLEGWAASSAARRESRSAFLRAASAFLASASSLYQTCALATEIYSVPVCMDRLTSWRCSWILSAIAYPPQLRAWNPPLPSSPGPRRLSIPPKRNAISSSFFLCVAKMQGTQVGTWALNREKRGRGSKQKKKKAKGLETYTGLTGGLLGVLRHVFLSSHLG